MTILSDIRQMQAEGRTDPEIITALRERGVSPREITEALTQSKVKTAVVAPEAVSYETAPAQEEMPPQEAAPEMQPSMVPAEQQYQPQEAAYAQPQEQAYSPEYAQAQYQPQQPQMGGISPDTITEISEQVVAEKLSPLKDDIEKVIDMKTTIDSKMEYLDERLKRIEKIIDRLQLSIMQKVGDYMTNIDDIKKEIIETQKSFKSMGEVKPKKSKAEAQ